MNRKGFTLIELLAVIVILGIVVAVAIPGVNAVINNSKQNAINSEARLIEKAIINKLAAERDFDVNILNKNNLQQHLETDGSKYETFSAVKANGKIYVTIKKDGFVGNSSTETPPIIMKAYVSTLEEQFIEVFITDPKNITLPDQGYSCTEWVLYEEPALTNAIQNDTLYELTPIEYFGWGIYTIDMSHLDLSVPMGLNLNFYPC